MAPTRKRSKVGLTRMHAALDAMRPYGFTADIVRKCVKKILKVYGEEGWIFMEDAAYKLLIESILEEQEMVQFEDEPADPQVECTHGINEQPDPVPDPCDKEIICEEHIGTSNVREPNEAYDDAGMQVIQEDYQRRHLIIKRTLPSSKVCRDDGWAVIEEAEVLLSEVEKLLEEPLGVEHPQLECSACETDEERQSVPLRCDKELINEGVVRASDLHRHVLDEAIDIVCKDNLEHESVDKAAYTKLKDISAEPDLGIQLGFVSAPAPKPRDNNATSCTTKPCYGWISDEDIDDLQESIPEKLK